jgi:hypothetical protein
VTSAIDIDAIPLDLPVQQQPVAALYLATVETLPDGREIVMPHHEPVWQWFGKEAPTLAHGRQGDGGLPGRRQTRPLAPWANVASPGDGA